MLIMGVFGLHQHVISEYATYSRSFAKNADARFGAEVERQNINGRLSKSFGRRLGPWRV
jgi:hypothetical protein